MTPPRVFISYSHDSSTHKKWVLDLATTLRNRGIDAVIDQWDLKPGDDLAHFMEKSLSDCAYAIMVCTRQYVEKANAGTGGVGYEKMIMTYSSLSSISGNKVIPIIREQGNPPTPTFLNTKLYVDFTDDTEIEYALDELLRTLLQAPLYKKPEIGEDPFRALENSRPDRVADGVRTTMTEIAEEFNHSHEEYILFYSLVIRSKVHRLTLEKYINESVKRGLLTKSMHAIKLTDDGRVYLVEHGIVDA